MGEDLTLPVAAAAITLLVVSGLGVVLWLLHRRGVRRIGLAAAHFLLGAVALEQVVMLMRVTGDGTVPAPTLAGGLAFAALFSGILMAMFFSRSRGAGEASLYVHIGLGAGTLAVFLVWAARL